MLGMYCTLLFDPPSSLVVCSKAVLLYHLSLIVAGHSNNFLFFGGGGELFCSQKFQSGCQVQNFVVGIFPKGAFQSIVHIH